MHEADGVDGMQHKTLECAGLLRSNQVVVAGIGVDDAAASGRNAIKAAFVDRFEERENGARSQHLLRFDQLLATPELAGCDVILHARHHHRNIVQGFEMHDASATIPTFMTCASICPNPAESVCRPAPSGMRMPADRIMGLTISPTRNANCSTINSRTNVGPVQIHLRLGHRRLRACPLRGKKSLLPAERASAEAAMAEAQVDLDRTYVRAGVDGGAVRVARRRYRQSHDTVCRHPHS